ncbi:methyltransferase domain-containing protein [Hydrogenophaga sp. PBL-H3]|nr:methyltransferase domain-containing protein [Hydrogenophaga sp. PBL-H3]QHE82562.1 methyltransferase domain-containing protein [Hydrogenophaga sp. PBL-H3]
MSSNPTKFLKRVTRRLTREARKFSRRNPPTTNPGAADRLHLGCGNVRLPGFCNVDILTTHAVDVISDISKLDNFKDESIALIYACHVLEHFSHDEALDVLQRWFEVLKPGGELRVSVPDIDRIVKIYTENWQHFQTPGHSPWIGLLYGGQVDPYDFHKTGFNFCWMKHLLEKVGFEEVHEYPHEPHFLPGVEDASLAKEPFGQFFSLNVLARKPT